MRGKEQAYQKRKYIKRKLEHRCTRCGQPRHSLILGENYEHCYSCLQQRRLRYTVKRIRLVPQQFCKAKGICTTCRKSPVTEKQKQNGKSYASCEACLNRARIRHHKRVTSEPPNPPPAPPPPPQRQRTRPRKSEPHPSGTAFKPHPLLMIVVPRRKVNRARRVLIILSHVNRFVFSEPTSIQLLSHSHAWLASVFSIDLSFEAISTA